jgi:hypothetical protein
MEEYFKKLIENAINSILEFVTKKAVIIVIKEVSHINIDFNETANELLKITNDEMNVS